MLTKNKALRLWNESLAKATSRGLWSTGLLIASSAALGGIAVALWNRQALTRMRVAEEAGEPSVAEKRDASLFEED